MKMRGAKRGVISLGLMAAVTAQAGEYLPVTRPIWKDERIATVRYNYQGDQRKGQDMFDFRINEEGVIEGQELLDLTRPGEFARFEAAIRDNGGIPGAKVSPQELYRQYLEQLSDQGMAVLTLSRILDHEAMKRKMPPEVSNERVNYVLRSILIQNAANQRKIAVRETVATQENQCGFRVPVKGTDGKEVKVLHPDENLSARSSAEMFEWLKTAVGSNVLTINVDWEYDEGGMDLALDRLRHSRNELPWPGVTLRWEKFPATWQAFRDSVRAQLQPAYRKLLRMAILERMVQERNPAIQWQSIVAANQQQLDRMYQVLSATGFRIHNYRAEIAELRLEGPRAADFKARFLALLDERESKHDSDFHFAPGVVPTEADEDRLMKHADDLRHRIPSEVYQKTVLEFASDLANGRLKASIANRTLTHSEDDALLRAGETARAKPKSKSNSCDAPSFAELETDRAFDGSFAVERLFPRMTGTDTDQSIKIMMLQKQEELASTLASKDDPRVERVLRRKVESKLRGKAYRKLVFDLLRENGLEIRANTCSQPEWPCLSFDHSTPARWAEALFPERLFPGMSLPADAGLSSTLNRDDLLDRVMEISTDLVSTIIQTSNNHVDAATAFHNY